MSELKRHHINEVMDMHNLTRGEMSYSFVYYADDVDKVIAEKDKELCRHKYKRCLAVAMWCRLHDEFTQLESERLGLPQRAIFMEYRRKAMWLNKWHKHWLELAEKFKEAK